MLFANTANRRITAIVTLVAMVAAILAAGVSRIAETPAAGATGQFIGFGPGALGKTRFELSRVGLPQFKVAGSTAKRALMAAPSSDDALAGIAAAGLSDQQPVLDERQIALLNEAVRRNPRARSARIILLREMAKRGDVKAAFAQLAVLTRLSPEIAERLMDALVARISTVPQLEQAMAALQGHEILYQPFIYRMIGKNKSPEIVRRMAALVPAQIMAKRDIRNGVTRLLVDAGEIAAARSVWQTGVSGSSGALVHSPDFSDRKAPPPFNWDLSVGPTGAAERQPGGGLLVSYYDRTPGNLVSQLLTLSPGTYQARVDYEVIDGSVDNVRLRITCLGNGATIGETALARTRAGLIALSIPLKVPASGCTAQSAAIVGIAGENRGQMQLHVRRFDIARQGAK